MDAQADARPRSAEVPLSIGHNDSKTENQQLRESDARSVVLWKGATRADLPGISDTLRRAESQTCRKPSTRGLIFDFTDGSRRYYKCKLETIIEGAPAFTMALTLPGSFDHIPSPVVKRLMLGILKRFTASRDSLLSKVGLTWKQELQRRGAIHFHLLFWGVDAVECRVLQSWFAHQWWEALGPWFLSVKDSENLLWHGKTPGNQGGILQG
jgi:hypothetical protein